MIHQVRSVISAKHPFQNPHHPNNNKNNKKRHNHAQQAHPTSSLHEKHEDPLDQELKQLMDEHIAQEVKETELKMKLMERDAIHNAFQNEFRAIETKIWAKVRQSKTPLRENTIQYVRQQIEQRRIALEQKYRQIGRLVGKEVRDYAAHSLEKHQQKQRLHDNDDSSQMNGGADASHRRSTMMMPPSPLEDLSTFEHISKMAEQESDEDKKKAYDHIMSFMNKEDNFVNDPFFLGLSSAFERATGEKIDVNDMKQRVTEADLDKFFKMLEGKEGREMEERMNSVLTDKTLKNLGIDPSEFNPDALSKAKVNTERNSTSTSDGASSNQGSSTTNASAQLQQQQQQDADNFNFNSDRIEDIKYMMKKELERNPGLSKMLESETGSNMEAVFDEFEEALKNGQLFQSMSNADRIMLANALDFNEMRASMDDEEVASEIEKDKKQKKKK